MTSLFVQKSWRLCRKVVSRSNHYRIKLLRKTQNQTYFSALSVPVGDIVVFNWGRKRVICNVARVMEVYSLWLWNFLMYFIVEGVHER